MECSKSDASSSPELAKRTRRIRSSLAHLFDLAQRMVSQRHDLTMTSNGASVVRSLALLAFLLALQVTSFAPRPPFQQPRVSVAATKIGDSNAASQNESIPSHSSEERIAEDSSSDPPTSLASPPLPPNMKAYSVGFTTVFEELPFGLRESSTQQLPDDLVGTYFRAGPAMFSAGSIVPPKTSIVQPRQPPVPDGTTPERMVRHPMEGDGAVLGVTFGGGEKVAARYRFVRTTAFTNERKKGARIYTGMDSTRDESANDFPLPALRHHLQPGLNKSRKNTSNTRAIYWGNRLFSMWEGGQPYKLDALALSTDGRSRLGGAIKKDADPFGSKLSYDAAQNRALFYGVEHSLTDTQITLYEFDEDFRLVPGGRTQTTVPGFALITDFAATRNYAVFVQPSASVSKVQFLMSKEPGKSVKLESEPGIVHLIPRVGSNKPPLSIPIPSTGPHESNIHFCNAYEDGTTVILDSILSDSSSASSSSSSPKKASQWPWCTTLEEFQSVASKKSLWRYEIDTQQQRITKRLLLDQQCYFGGINPAYSGRQHRYVYAAAGAIGAATAPPQGIVRYDTVTSETETWYPPTPEEFCGEPMYAPRQGEGDSDAEDNGYVLTVTYDGARKESDILILQASNIAAGPVARIPLGIAIPHGYHGCFVAHDDADDQWSFDAIERRAKLADKMESRGNRWNEVKSDFSGLGLRLDDMEEYFGDFFN